MSLPWAFVLLIGLAGVVVLLVVIRLSSDIRRLHRLERITQIHARLPEGEAQALWQSEMVELVEEIKWREDPARRRRWGNTSLATATMAVLVVSLAATLYLTPRSSNPLVQPDLGPRVEPLLPVPLMFVAVLTVSGIVILVRTWLSRRSVCRVDPAAPVVSK
jgi:hypothetical protein